MPYTARVGSAPPEVRLTTPHRPARPSPVTPTPNHGVRGGSLMRSPISALEYGLKKSSREDGVFKTFKARLKEQKTLVSFKWDAESQTGTFVPVP